MSRKYRFEVHTRVTGPFHGVGVVDRNSGAKEKGEIEKCWVRTRATHPASAWYDEKELERISVWRFLLHENPDGSYQVGNTPLWAFVLSCIAAVLAWIYAENDIYSWVLKIALSSAVPLWIMFSCLQYSGKQR